MTRDHVNKPLADLGSQQQHEQQQQQQQQECDSNINPANPLQVPELLALVGNKLTRHTLTVCLRVARLWHNVFISSIYADLQIFDRHSAIVCFTRQKSPSLPSIEKNASSIRKLKIEGHENLFALDHLFCSSLAVLTLFGCEDVHNNNSNSENIDDGEHNQQLQEQLYRTLCVTKTLIRRHENTLTSLTVSPRTTVKILDAIMGCPNLRQLYLSDLQLTDDERMTGLETLQLKSTTSRLTGIRDLTLEAHQFDEEDFKIKSWLIEQCPDLVRLRWSLRSAQGSPLRTHDAFGVILTRTSNTAMSFLASQFRSDDDNDNNDNQNNNDENHGEDEPKKKSVCCQKLEMIALPGQYFDNKDFTTLLEHMVQISELDLARTNFGKDAWRILQEYPNHLNSILKVNLVQCEDLSTTVIHELLCCLPNLEVLIVDALVDTALSLTDRHRPWRCRRLKELDSRIVLETVPSVGQPLLLTRLSELVSLERWVIRSSGFSPDPLLGRPHLHPHRRHRRRADDVFQLTLDKGLDYLKTFRKLRFFQSAVRVTWGEAEADWVLDNWPDLQGLSNIDLNPEARLLLEHIKVD
ncbi:hypothetical protein BGZ83_009679 [Gryganskiella cystojenkinii]|nr:hypothetical protein BGZ83_009679 [Gryganskiella cystojenkinii]